MALNEDISIEEAFPQHWPQIFKLWDLSFGMPYDIHAQKEYVAHNLSFLLAAMHDDKVAAVAGVIDFEMMFDGKKIPCAGISAVATHPSFRRLGLTRKLLQSAMSRLHEKRVPLASLWPFSYPFYESFGWRASDTQFQVELSINDIPKIGTPFHYQEISQKDCSSLFALHEEWCRRWNLSLHRKEHRWRHMLSKPGISWFILKHQEGYMLASLKDNASTLVIREWCYLSDKAFYDGLAILKQMDSQYNKVRWTTGETDTFFQLGIPAHKPEIQLLPGMMTRVVNPEAFAEILPGGLAGIKIVDPLGISDTASAGEEVDPGSLIQIVTGLFQKPPSGKPGAMHNLCGKQKAFSVEKF